MDTRITIDLSVALIKHIDRAAKRVRLTITSENKKNRRNGMTTSG